MKGWEKEYAWLAYDDENNAMFWQNIALFSFALRVVAVGKIPVRLESGERMRSRPESRTSKVSGGLVNFLVY